MVLQVHAQERARVEFPYQGGTVVISADRLFKESEERWIADGRVVVQFEDTVLEASRLSYNPLIKEVVLEGSVELKRGVQWLKASRAEIQIEADSATLYDATGFTDQALFVQARKLIRKGRSIYHVQSGFVTACEGAVPKWSFQVNRAKIDLRSSAHLRHPVFRVRGVPIFYLPYVVFPTEKKTRSSGLLVPSTGKSNNKGRRFSQSFYLVLGRSADLMLREDYFSQRGFGHGFTFRARPHLVSRLELDAYTIQDRKGQGGSSVSGSGETRFDNGFRAVANFNLVSNFIFRQVFSEDFYTATRPTRSSQFFLTNSYRSRSFNFLLASEETVFPGRNVVVRNTPSFSFKLTGQRFANLPLYLDLNASAEGLSRSDQFLETPGLTQRLDLFPQLHFSLHLFQGLELAPRLGLRETYYSDSVDRSLGGESDLVSGRDLHRQYLDFSLDLSGWGLSRVYQRSNDSGWKHLIEPVLRYRHIRGIDDFGQTLRFDEQDAIAETSEVEYALFNRIFLKRRGRSRPWLTLKVAQKYFFDPDFGGAFQAGAANQFFPLNTLTGFPYGGLRRDFSPLVTAIRFTPSRRFNFDVRGDYDPDFSRFRNFAVAGFYNRDQVSFRASYFVTQELEPGTRESNQVQAHVLLGNPGRGLAVSTLFSYDAKVSRFLSSHSLLHYFWDCCGVTAEIFGFNFGVRQERQLRFSFYLKGIGSFGNVRRPYRMD